MKRRAFLQVLAVTAVPLVGSFQGDTEDAYIQLYDGDKAVTKPLPTKFRWNSKMTVTVQPSQPIRVTRAVLYSPKVGRRNHDIDPLIIKPSTELTVTWEIGAVSSKDFPNSSRRRA